MAARPLTQLAEYSVNAHKSGVLQHTDFLKVRNDWHDLLTSVGVCLLILMLLQLEMLSVKGAVLHLS